MLYSSLSWLEIESTASAQKRIELLRQRFGEGHIYLACHAALPLALTPDLLYCLWINFQQDVYGQLLDIPWIAVADLLLSNLCHEVGYELYELDSVVRNLLLVELETNPRLGVGRVKELSEFLLNFVQPQFENHDPDLQNLAQVQRWAALAYVQPQQLKYEMLSSISKLDLEDSAEWIRMASLAETLTEPLVEFDSLLIYVRGIRQFARGNLQAAATELSALSNNELQVQIDSFVLDLPLGLPAIETISHQSKAHDTEASEVRHLLLIEDDQGRREFILENSVYSIGRDPKCDIRLVSQFVSRRHATLVQLPRDDGSFYYRIVDGNLKGKISANGLFINGRRLQAHDLQNEDVVIFDQRQVRAIYYALRRDALVSIPPDEFDITLISPLMVQAEYDDVEKISNQSQEHPDVEIRTKDFNVEKNSNQSQVEGIEVSQIDHLFIIEDNKGRREFILDSPVYSIGRDPKCDIRLVSDFVSRRHATLVKLQNEDGSFYYRIIDGNLKGKPSGNGLLINGRKLRHADLKDEDEIVFGPQVSAIYYLLRREVSYPDFLDEFDITLIAPNHWSLDND